MKFAYFMLAFLCLIHLSTQNKNKLKNGKTCHSHGQCLSHCCVTIRGKADKETGTKMDLMSGLIIKSTCQPQGKLGDRCHLDQQLARSDNDYCGKCQYPLQCGGTGFCVQDPHPSLQTQRWSSDYQE